jgi:hypothetical protein
VIKVSQFHENAAQEVADLIRSLNLYGNYLAKTILAVQMFRDKEVKEQLTKELMEKLNTDNKINTFKDLDEIV